MNPDQASDTGVATEPAPQRRIQQLEAELEELRGELEVTVADLEASNEELRVSNEQLHDLSAELQRRAEELGGLNAEMNSLLESTEIATLLLDRELRVRRVTGPAFRLFGARTADTGRKLGEFQSAFGQLHHLDLVRQAQQVLFSQQPHSQEVQSKEGLWYQRRIHPFIDAAGKAGGVVVSFIEIDRVKRTERALARSEARLVSAQRIADMGDFTWDAATGEVTWSRALYDLLGYSPIDEIDFSRVNEEIHPAEELDDIMAWLTACIERRDGILTPNEYHVLRKDGTRLDVRCQGVIDYDDQGNAKIFATLHDITERKELERFKQRITDSAISGVYLYDLNPRRTVFLNQRYTSLAGYSLADFESMTLEQHDEIFHPDDRDTIRAHGQALIASAEGEVLPLEYRLRRKDGRVIWCMSFDTVFERDAAGGPVRILGSFIDITDLKTTALELEHRNEELSQFAFVAAHDLQEPLRTLRSYSELLTSRYSEQLDETGARCLGFIGSAAERMSQLIHALLDYSRVGRDHEIQTIDTRQLLTEIEDDLEAKLQDSRAVVEAGDLPVVCGHRADWRVLLQNLISNAIKFARQDVPPKIRVDARRDGDRWLWSVEDNGIGIAPEYRDKIFGVFQRLHSQAEIEGTGIGLAACRKAVEEFGGEIWCDAAPGQGTVFYFSQPDVAVPFTPSRDARS